MIFPVSQFQFPHDTRTGVKTGEYRAPKVGEWYLQDDYGQGQEIEQCTYQTSVMYEICVLSG